MKLPLSDIALGASLSGLMPLLAIQSAHLWERPHFQFFPLAWLALVGLIAVRAKLGSPESVGRRRCGLAVWAAGLVVGAGAAGLFSPWMGQVAVILCVTGWGLVRLEAVPWTRWLGWTALLWVTLPLPGSFDAQLVGKLQTLSSESASSLLDLMGLAHLRQGNLIEIRAGKLFVDEACSGIDSLYSLAAIGLAMVLWQKRPLVVGLLTLLSVPLWAWLGNVLRLVAIAWFLDRWQIDLSHGWMHTLLGFVVFAMASGCLFLTLDAAGQLLQNFSRSDMPGSRKRWHQWYNAIVSFPGEAGRSKRRKAKYPAAAAAATGNEPARAWGWSKALIAVVVLMSMAVGSVSLWAVARKADGSAFALPHYELAQVDSAFLESAMPASLHGATRVGFDKEQRSPNSFFGEYSRIWRYRQERSGFLLSTDFPFRGFHPLWVCYTNAGNTLDGEPQRLQLPTTTGSTATGPAAGEPTVAFAKLKDDLGSTSYLWFTLFESSGQPVAIRKDNESVGNQLLERFTRANEASLQAEPVTYQFQLYVQSGSELPQAELDRYLKVFAEALPYAVEQVKRLDEAKG